MPWEGGHIRVNHLREPWGSQDTIALIHCRIAELEGTDHSLDEKEKRLRQETYAKAKLEFDKEAALDLVEVCKNETTIDRIADVIFERAQNPIYVFPHPAFEDANVGNVPITNGPMNALPFAYAHYLVEVLGGTVNDTILQIARVGTTQLPHWKRYLYQPSFQGAVDQKRPYIVLDDVMSIGGTFACLRSYIVRNGGTVAATTALASKSGVHEKFAIADQTLNVLKSTYGQEIVGFWKDGFGHELHTLTEPEGQYLLFFARQVRATARLGPLHALREKFNSTATNAGER